LRVLLLNPPPPASEGLNIAKNASGTPNWSPLVSVRIRENASLRQ